GGGGPGPGRRKGGGQVALRAASAHEGRAQRRQEARGLARAVDLARGKPRVVERGPAPRPTAGPPAQRGPSGRRLGIEAPVLERDPDLLGGGRQQEGGARRIG